MTIKTRKLGYALGAEVTGIDISKPLEKPVLDELYQAFLENLVLVFRGQPLTREQHIAFSSQFGELNRNEGRAPDTWSAEHPELFLVISRPKPDGTPATGRHTGAEWHTDNTHWPAAGQASILRALEIPEVGGDTLFCNMYNAYDALSDGMKQLLEPLYGVHTVSVLHIDYSTPERYKETRARYKAAAHPVIMKHPDSGRKSLYVNTQVRRLVGFTAEESRPLVRYLVEQSTHPQNIYRHQWRKNDLVMWDNRCTLHMALANYDRRQLRHMERTTVNAHTSGYVWDGPLE